jgi:hypothetical protein
MTTADTRDVPKKKPVGLRFQSVSNLWLANCYFAHVPQNFPRCYYSSMRNLRVEENAGCFRRSLAVSAVSSCVPV